jgi:hypothetical protein
MLVLNVQLSYVSFAQNTNNMRCLAGSQSAGYGFIHRPNRLLLLQLQLLAHINLTHIHCNSKRCSTATFSDKSFRQFRLREGTHQTMFLFTRATKCTAALEKRVDLFSSRGHFGRPWCLHREEHASKWCFRVKTEAVRSFEALVSYSNSTRRHNWKSLELKCESC